jgi:hypothetical protein
VPGSKKQKSVLSSSQKIKYCNNNNSDRPVELKNNIHDFWSQFFGLENAACDNKAVPEFGCPHPHSSVYTATVDCTTLTELQHLPTQQTKRVGNRSQFLPKKKTKEINVINRTPGITSYRPTVQWGHSSYPSTNMFAQSNTTHDVTIFIIGNRFRSHWTSSGQLTKILK